MAHGINGKNRRQMERTGDTDSPVRDSLGFSDVFNDQVLVDSLDFAVFMPVDSMIQNAVNACTIKKFGEGHKILKNALEIAQESSDEENDTAGGNSKDFILQIAQVYMDRFPKEYLDSIPAELMSTVFQYQIAKAIDTLAIDPRDSLLLSIRFCENSIPYNIPITHNKKVEKILYFLTKTRSQATISLLNRLSYYNPLMKRIFSNYAAPTDLMFLPLLESGYNTRAYSYKHAAGIWQFIPQTGLRFGLRQDFWIDERRDPIKSTQAAIAYLLSLYGMFKDWHLALAAYNCGEGKVMDAIGKSQNADFWRLRLPKQTSDYVPQFIAYQIIAKNPHCFGFMPQESDTFALDTLHISKCIDLKKIAGVLNISYTQLKEYNPHLKQWCTPPMYKDVVLYIPPRISRKTKLAVRSLPAEEMIRYAQYKVMKHDNISSIARRFKATVKELQSLNRLHGKKLLAGTYITVPINRKLIEALNSGSPGLSATGSSTGPVAGNKKTISSRSALERTATTKIIKYRVHKGETLYQIAKTFDLHAKNIMVWNNIKNPALLREGQVIRLYKQVETTDTPIIYYIVQEGDNLSSIADTFGVSVSSLYKVNGLKKNSKIKPGHKLRIMLNGES